MQNVMRTIMCVMGLVCCITAGGYAQRIPGNALSKVFSSDLDLKSATISRDGKTAVVEFADQIWGISIADGKTVWTRKLKDDYKNDIFNCIEWVTPSEITIPTESGLEWVEAATGKVFATVPFMGEGLASLTNQKSDAASGTWTVRPRRIGYVLIVPFESGYQIFDLKARKELYRSTEELDDLRIEYWGTTVFLHGDMPTGIVIDVEQPRVLVKHVMEGEKIDPFVFQNLFRYKDQIAIVTEEHVVCYNASTGQRVGVLGFDPEDQASYSVVLLRDTLVFLARSEEFLRLYNVGSGKTTWSFAADSDKLGQLAYAWPLPDGNLLAEFFDSDDHAYLAVIDASTGRFVWNKKMIHSESEFESGHRFSTSVTFSFGTTRPPTPMLGYRPVFTDSIDRQTFYAQNGIDSARPYEPWQFVSLLNRSIVHEKSKSLGMLDYIGTYGNVIVMQGTGNVRRAWDGKTSDEDYDAEGMLRIDASTGNVLSFVPVPFVKDMDLKDFNVSKFSRPFPTEHGTVVLGSHTIAHVRMDGNIDTIGFPVKEEWSLSMEDRGKDYVTLEYLNDDESQFIWKVTMSATGMSKELLGVSDTKGTFSSFTDTTFVPVTLRFVDGKLQGYPVMSEVPKQWPAPLWTLSEEQMTKVGIEDVIDKTQYWNATGIIPYRDVVYLLGGSGLGVIDPKTGCFSSIPWEGFNSSASLSVPVKRFGYKLINGAVFDMGEDVGLVKVGPGCELKLIGYVNENRADMVVVYSIESGSMMIVDEGENRIDVYQLK